MPGFLDFAGGFLPYAMKKVAKGGFFGSKDKTEQLPTKTPEQQAASRDFFSNPIQNSPLYGSGQSYLQSILGNDPNAFAGFEAPYMQNFQQQIIPQISERFAGMGTGAGALNSSGLNQTLGMAGSTLQNQLAQLRAQIQQGASGQALQYAQQPYNNLLAGMGQNHFENIYKPGQPGLGQGLVGGAVGGLQGFMMGGPPGAAIGAANGFAGAYR